MSAAKSRTYRTAAFAALAGVTPRALRLYDRLGLLRPARSAAGYRLYTDRDVEVLQAIVALKFIGVPLKEIATMRRRDSAPLARVLRAQREALETKRRQLTSAIAAISAGEAALRSGVLDSTYLKRIIEVMQMDKNHEEAVASYSAILQAKVAYLSSMTTAERDALKERWSALFDDIRGALDDDPSSPRAQDLLDRWLVLLREFGGSDQRMASHEVMDSALQPSAKIRDDVWARRTAWLPAGTTAPAADTADGEAALARARELAESFASADVMEFIARARAARG